MTVDEIKARLDAILTMDDEVAHSSADALWRDVFADIAAGDPEAAEKARLALTVDEMGFARWCA